MADPITRSDHTRSTPGPGVELRWPAAALWRDGEPEVRKITTTDVWEALARGYDDFRAIPTHAFFICLIYPVAGLILFRLSFGYEILPLLYPMIAGFALLGPFVAIGLYELSRRREQGLDITPMRTFEVVRRPSFGAICRLGIVLAAIFVAWLYAANLIYVQIFGHAVPPFITGLTGIDSRMVRGKPAFGEVADDVRAVLGDRQLDPAREVDRHQRGDIGNAVARTRDELALRQPRIHLLEETPDARASAFG